MMLFGNEFPELQVRTLHVAGPSLEEGIPELCPTGEDVPYFNVDRLRGEYRKVRNESRH